MANMKGLHYLLPVQQLRYGMCHGFHIDEQEAIEGFLINWRGEIHAYRNSCPHTGVTLNWAPDQFLDFQNRYIHCGLHGALFEPDTGLCIHGPCLGQSLVSLPIRIDDNQVFLDLREYGV